MKLKIKQKIVGMRPYSILISINHRKTWKKQIFQRMEWNIGAYLDICGGSSWMNFTIEILVGIGKVGRNSGGTDVSNSQKRAILNWPEKLIATWVTGVSGANATITKQNQVTTYTNSVYSVYSATILSQCTQILEIFWYFYGFDSTLFWCPLS